MKRFLVFALLAVLLIFQPDADAEEAYFALNELETPARWVQTFQTPWREVAINAEIVLPQAERLPVVRLAGGAAQPAMRPDEAGWNRMECRSAYELILIGAAVPYPKSVNGVRVGAPVSKGVWYDGFAPENRYVPLDDITFGEIVSQLRERTAQLGYDPDAFLWEKPERLWTHHLYASGSQTDLLPGSLSMEVLPLAEGIPVFSHVLTAHTAGGGTQRSDECFLTPSVHAGYNGYSQTLSHLFLCPLTVEEVLADDVPLCSFSRVLSAVESEILAGRIRKIYKMELGYVLYNEPGVSRAVGGPAGKRMQNQNVRFYAKPMWRIGCLYVPNPDDALRSTSGYTDDERNSLDFFQLLIDAQTGERLQPSEARDRCEFKGFLSWEDVR